MKLATLGNDLLISCKPCLLFDGRTGSGKISAAGGNGFAGGGGGRLSIDVFSRHDDTQFFVHGNNSLLQKNRSSLFLSIYFYGQSCQICGLL